MIYDKVPQKRLLKSLGYGIRGKVGLHRWIKDFFFKNISQEVVIHGKCSDSANVTSGIPHGSVLGPILFPDIHK